MPAPLFMPALKLQVGAEARAFRHLLAQCALVKCDQLVPDVSLPSAEGPSDPQRGTSMCLGGRAALRWVHRVL